MTQKVPTERAQRVKKALKKFVTGPFKVSCYQTTDDGWMAMISLPGNISRRFRAYKGCIVDETIVGDGRYVF